MRKFVIGFVVLLMWCMLLLSYQPVRSQGVMVWTEKGCDASYSPGEVVKIHYSFDNAGWSRVFKQYPDTHEEEIAGWRYFSTGGEYVELDTLGPECGKITYTVRFYEDMGFCPVCIPCHICGPSVVYVSETGNKTCSITVVCDLSSMLFTDKKEYLSGIDSHARISLHITDVQGTPLDVDSVVIDVNGDSIAAIKSSPGVYSALYTLSGRKQGVYVVTASIFKRDYPDETRTAAFKIVVPVTISLSTDRQEYTPGDDVVVRAEVKDSSLRGVNGLHFDVSISDTTIPFLDKGGGIYEAQVNLSDFELGDYTLDIKNMEEYIRIDHVYGGKFRVTGLPSLLLELPEPLELSEGQIADLSINLLNGGEGDASNITLSVEAPPGIDIQKVSGYAFTLPAGSQSEAYVSMMGLEEGEYSLSVMVTYEDAGGKVHTASHTLSVQVKSRFPLLLILGVAVIAAVGVAIIILLIIRSKRVPEKSS
ncbi:MAG: hypothetical protein HXS53_07110 [Theionarchaea archaeon]|nr:hypothetical protein [Theionarchaea archaeon]